MFYLFFQPIGIGIIHHKNETDDSLIEARIMCDCYFIGFYTVEKTILRKVLFIFFYIVFYIIFLCLFYYA